MTKDNAELIADSTSATWSKSGTRIHAIIRAALNEHNGTFTRTNAKADAIVGELLAAGLRPESEVAAEVLRAVIAEYEGGNRSVYVDVATVAAQYGVSP